MGPYILDFNCAELRLAVEIDGEAHARPEQIAHDERRDADFEAQGIRTLRLGLNLLKNPGAAADHILDVIRRG